MRWFCFVAGSAGVFVGSVRAGIAAEAAPNDDGKALSANFERLERVFSPFAIPNVKGKAWVAVDVGPTNHAWEQSGWVVEEGTQGMTLVDSDGGTHRLRRPTPNEVRPRIKEEKNGGFLMSNIHEADRSVAWKVAAADYLAESKRFLTNGLPSVEDTGGRGMSGLINPYYALADRVVDAARLALFARQLGENEHAADLYRLAVAGRKKHAERYADEKTSGLHLFVADRLAFNGCLGAKNSAHGGAARQELLKQWEIVAAIPHHRYRDEAQEMVRHYESLLDEDNRWVEPKADELAKMTAEQQVAYWLYHLRDLDVGQHMNPGRCFVFFSSARRVYVTDPEVPHPAEELDKLGMAAIPHIIAHLDDERPTRCKGHWRFWSPEGHHLLHYSDCCQQIFERITGHTIFNGAKYPSETGEARQCKERAEKWWKEYQTKGEKQMLIEGTAAGDRDSLEHVQRLVKKYPEAALAPIIQGARASKDGGTRARLVVIASELKDPEVVAFWREELDGPHFQSRVRAARCLLTRGDAEGGKAILRKWKSLPEQKIKAWDERDAIKELTDALSRSGDPAAIRSLGDELEHYEKYIRSTIIDQLAVAETNLRDEPLSREAIAAIEDVLVKIMENRAEENACCLRDGDSMHDPMLDELAANALAKRWKQPTIFDIEGPLQVRERQRLEVKNVWLVKRGKEPMPVPALRKVKPAFADEVDSLLKVALGLKTSKERIPHFRSIEKLGLAALPAVRTILGTLKEDHPARNDLKALAVRLALIVEEVRFSVDTVPPDNETRAKFEALRGKQITDSAFLDLFREIASSLPKGVCGIKITLERIPDETGTYLEVTLIARNPASASQAPALLYGNHMRVGEQRFGGGTGTFSGIGPDDGFSKIDWGDLDANLRIVFNSAPEEYAFVQIYYAERR